MYVCMFTCICASYVFINMRRGKFGNELSEMNALIKYEQLTLHLWHAQAARQQIMENTKRFQTDRNRLHSPSTDVLGRIRASSAGTLVPPPQVANVSSSPPHSSSTSALAAASHTAHSESTSSLSIVPPKSALDTLPKDTHDAGAFSHQVHPHSDHQQFQHPSRSFMASIDSGLVQTALSMPPSMVYHEGDVEELHECNLLVCA